MSTVVADDGTVNPPPALEGQTFTTKKVKDARGNLVTDKGANGAFLACVRHHLESCFFLSILIIKVLLQPSGIVNTR